MKKGTDINRGQRVDVLAVTAHVWGDLETLVLNHITIRAQDINIK